MEDVFRALADSSRRQLLDSLHDRNGQTLRELCAGLDMARQSVSKHLAQLEAANLVTTVWHGREKRHYLNAAPIADMTERWISKYDRERVDALSDLKRALEDTTMEHKPEFVYTTYINTSPKRLWDALTDPAFTRRYWGLALESKWTIGSPITWHIDGGVTIADPEQVVLESDPPRRLAYTWHTFTREFADHHRFSDEFLAAVSSEPRSRVAFDIEPVGDMVKLTVVHGGFEPGSTVLESIGGGWPQLLSSLKSLLETGETLPIRSDEARRDREVAPT